MPQPDLIKFYTGIFQGTPPRRRFAYSLDDLRRYGKRGLVPIRKGDDDGNGGADDIDIDDDELRRLLLDQQADDDETGDDEAEDDEADEQTNKQHQHVVSTLADLIAEANDIPRQRALYWLLHTRSGQALAYRTRRKRQAKRGNNAMSRIDGLRSIIKSSGGLEPFCKAVVADPSIGGRITEHEFTALCTETARKLYP